MAGLPKIFAQGKSLLAFFFGRPNLRTSVRLRFGSLFLPPKWPLPDLADIFISPLVFLPFSEGGMEPN